MKVIVDTSVWSLALRRQPPYASSQVALLKNLILDHRVQMLGAIRQEILSGISDKASFEKLKTYLEAFPDLNLEVEAYVRAAKFYNICRAKGIQGSNTDFLICSGAAQNQYSILTTDQDFFRFAKYLPITLYPMG